MNSRDEQGNKFIEIDTLIEDLKNFRQETLEKLNIISRQLDDYPSIQSRADAYWIAHVKAALSDDNYPNRFQTTLSSTVGELLDEIGAEYESGEELETEINIRKLLREMNTETKSAA